MDKNGHKSFINKKQMAFWSLIFSSILFSSSGLLVRVLSFSYSVSGQVLLRAFVISLLLFIVAKFRKQSLSVKGINKFAFIIFLISLPLGNLAFATSVNLIKATNTVFYLYFAQFITGLFIGRFVLKEKISSKNIISFFLAFLGIIVFSYPIQVRSFLNLGVILGLFTGLMETIKNSSMKYLKSYSKQVLTFYQFFVSMMLILIYSLLFNIPVQIGSISFVTVIAIGIIVFISIGINYLLLFGMGNFDVNLANIIISSELVFASIINAIFLNELPTINEFFGSLLIVLALIVVNTKFNKLEV